MVAELMHCCDHHDEFLERSGSESEIIFSDIQSFDIFAEIIH